MNKVICPNCKAENDASNQFCKTCGTPLPAPATDAKTTVAARTKAAAVPPPPPTAGATPPPPPAYTPPPPPAYTPSIQYMGTPIKKLGVRSDGWSDVVEGGAAMADSVRHTFAEEMNGEGIPGLRITDVTLTSNKLEARPFQLLTDGRGTTITVRITPFGNNLFVGWDLYVKRSINWLTVGILGGVVFLLAFFDTLISVFYYSFEFFSNFFGFIGTFISWLLVPTLIVLLFGKILKDDWLAFFVKSMNEFETDDAVSLSTVVDNVLTRSVEKCKNAPAAKTKK